MDDPLAFFLTWTTYGSWLPGDDRGWVQKSGQRKPPSTIRTEHSRQALVESVFKLTWPERQLIENTIKEHCHFKGWYLHAVNCRTQHVHVVVTAPNRHPNDVLIQLKAWCTRRLKERQIGLNIARSQLRENWWTQGGSKQRIYTNKSLEAVIEYVLEGQGDEPRNG